MNWSTKTGSYFPGTYLLAWLPCYGTKASEICLAGARMLTNQAAQWSAILWMDKGMGHRKMWMEKNIERCKFPLKLYLYIYFCNCSVYLESEILSFF